VYASALPMLAAMLERLPPAELSAPAQTIPKVASGQKDAPAPTASPASDERVQQAPSSAAERKRAGVPRWVLLRVSRSPRFRTPGAAETSPVSRQASPSEA
jgi:hypothetical protein